MSVTLKCSEHPQYQAKRRPRADCAGCRVLWELRIDFSDPCAVGTNASSPMDDLHAGFNLVRGA